MQPLGDSFVVELLGKAYEGILLIDGEGIITWASPPALEALGCAEEAIVGARASSALDLGETPGVAGAVAMALSGGERWESPPQGVCLGAQGLECFQARLRVEPLRDGMAVFFVDASHGSKAAEAAKSMASVTSHELKTPLSAIKATSELLISYEFEPPKQKELLNDVYRQAERMEFLIRDILDASHIETGEVPLETVPVDFEGAVHMAMEELHARLAGRDVELAFEPGLPRVAADPEKLHQILVNLLTNAVKYSPEGSPISVSARVEQDFVRVEILDHGIGIKALDLERLFKKFQRLRDPASRRVEGTGLGLYIVKGLVELHGGSISVRSEPGLGSVFSFAFPAALEGGFNARPRISEPR